MDLIIYDSKNRQWEGVVLAAGHNRLRVMFRGASDITELNRRFGQWTLENGEPVDLGFVAGDERLDWLQICEETLPRYYTA